MRLALVMIARDEAERIGRALESVRDLVDEMIVLDTGSLDDTPAIAAGCGARVHRFDWIRDFAAARNAALSHSSADWNLILDADEWLEDGAEALSPAARARWNARPPFIGRCQVISAIAHDGGTGAAASWIPRLLPRGVRYVGRVHEQPDSALPHRRVEVRLGHDGYLPDALARKAGRNLSLLEEELKRAPDDGYLWFQLGKEHQAAESAVEAAQAFASAYNLCPPDSGWRHALVVRAISAMKAAGAVEDARALADAEAGRFGDSPDFWFVVGDLYLEWASRHPAEAGESLPICEYAWKRCLEIGERDDLDGAVRGRGGYMAAHNLAVLYGTLGVEAEAVSYRDLAERLKAA